jgi:hypothetical protein
VLDPAGYGAFTITQSISIMNDGVGTAGVQAGSGATAITINAGTNDTVHLRGLTVEGANVATNGIVLNSGGSLTVANCTVRHFTSYGILVAPVGTKTQLLVTNSLVLDNAVVGIYIAPQNDSHTLAIGQVQASIDRVTVSHSQYGFDLYGGFNSSYPSSIIISNSNITFNVTGLYVYMPNVFITKNIISGNATGIDLKYNDIYSYNDNDIYPNTTPLAGGGHISSAPPF